jgi:hypothetical protein
MKMSFNAGAEVVLERLCEMMIATGGIAINSAKQYNIGGEYLSESIDLSIETHPALCIMFTTQVEWR